MEKMLQSMMKRFPLFIGMGFMIVVIATLIAAWNASNAAAYYEVEKITRETSAQWIQVRATVEATLIWLPYLKFLGVAMILGGITMALGVIALRLQKLGEKVMASVPENARLPLPERPRSVMLMRMFMMLGMMIIVVGLVIALVVAGDASFVYSNPVPAIDAAATGSAIRSAQASVHGSEPWLEALKFVGIAFLFMGIVNGLTTIIFSLRYQWNAIPEVARKLPAHLATPVTSPVGTD